MSGSLEEAPSGIRPAVERLARAPDEDELFADLEQFVATHGISLDVEAMLDDIGDGRQ